MSNMTVAAYAAKQPRGNELWQRIIDQMMDEIVAYLSFFDIAAS